MIKENLSQEIESAIKELVLGNLESIETITNSLHPHKKRFLVSTTKEKYLFKYANGNVRENLYFLKHLNSKKFPTQQIYLPSNENWIIYEFLEGEMKNNATFDETLDIANLIARLHEESNNYLGNKNGEYGLTHGDLKLQNIIFVDGQPHLIDFERMKKRFYIADVTGYLFYNTLSDIERSIITEKDARTRTNLFIEQYVDYRKIKFDLNNFNECLIKHSDWFRDWSKRKTPIENKIDLIDKTLETLLQ